jgi:hypothetical protein
MTIARQLQTRAYESLDLTSLDNRIFALEHSSTAVPGNIFYSKHFCVRSALGTRLTNLHNRVIALEASTTAKVDFNVRLARRAPLDGELYSLHTRLVNLGG